jgi:hypothetical protein
MSKLLFVLIMMVLFLGCQQKQETSHDEMSHGEELGRSKAPEGAAVYFITPQDGDVIEGEVTVKFGLKGMGVAPAGTIKEKTGHHHILIDVSEMPDMTISLPATDKIRHFGGGQTETQFTLQPGEHTLQLLLANHAHIPHDPPVLSEKITITVK